MFPSCFSSRVPTTANPAGPAPTTTAAHLCGGPSILLCKRRCRKNSRPGGFQRFRYWPRKIKRILREITQRKPKLQNECPEPKERPRGEKAGFYDGECCPEMKQVARIVNHGVRDQQSAFSKYGPIRGVADSQRPLRTTRDAARTGE